MKKQSKWRQTSDLQRILLSFSMLIFLLFLASCNAGSGSNNHSSKVSTDSMSMDAAQHTSQDSMVHFLLDAAARDFLDHQPPVPLGFRNVQFKYLTNPDEGKTYILCGQFLHQDNQNKVAWTQFATIKTDPYEQWMGSNAFGYCQDSEEITYTEIDLSVALKSRYDLLQKSSK